MNSLKYMVRNHAPIEDEDYLHGHRACIKCHASKKNRCKTYLSNMHELTDCDSRSLNNLVRRSYALIKSFEAIDEIVIREPFLISSFQDNANASLSYSSFDIYTSIGTIEYPFDQHNLTLSLSINGWSIGD
jgi:hypothetical protein